jgi:hypothetical protein
LQSTLNAFEDGALGSGSAILEIVVLLLCICAQLVAGGALVVGDTVAVKIVLQFAIGPGVENGVLGSVGLLGEIAGDRGKVCTTSFGGRSIVVLSLLDKVLTSGFRVLLVLLTIGFEVLLEILDGPRVKGPGRPAGSGLVSVESDLLQKLVTLAALGDGNTSGVEISLQA